jgi:hypothetical protein
MTTQVSFPPSKVYPFFPDSTLEKGEREIMAAHIAAFLADKGDNWETVIEWQAFAQFTRSAAMPHPVYQDPLLNPALQQGCQNALWWFAENGYTTWVKEGESFKVNAKLIEFYSKYVPS